MKHLYTNAKITEKALCLGLSLKYGNRHEDIDSLEELKVLAESAGAVVFDSILQIRDEISTKHYIGKGLVEEITALVQENSIDTVIFDNELTPVQVRNLESELKCKVIGRTELILDIFAQRAQTKIARLQVELAQLEFLRPRLRRAWSHLLGSQGGIGFRGPGETQLETDKRILTRRIAHIKRELKKLTTHIENSHKSRIGKNRICLVGYTNAGKSSLLNKMAGDKVLAKNMLFSTLDSTTRKLYINESLNVLISDTVGFIRRLPHLLVASFKSTLTEVLESDLLLHVIDVSREDVENQIKSVNEVLEEIGAANKKVIHVFNKTDKLESYVTKERFSSYPFSVFVSAATGEGLPELREQIAAVFNANSQLS